MRSLAVAAIIAVVVYGLPTAPALAHDQSVTTSFSDVGEGVSQTFDHIDQDPWKGWFTATVTNTSDQNWYDFHFEITYIGLGDISNVDIIDSTGYEPTSSQSGLTWVIDNSVVGATIDLYYLSDPVLPTETATFTIYTDNTTDQSSFGLLVYPTIPEPGTISLLGLAGMALLRRRRA